MYMQNAMYVVFGFWYLVACWSLVAGLGFLISGERSPSRPLWYYFFSFALGVVVTSVLLWFYSSGQISEWPTLIIGTLVFLPDLYYTLRSEGVIGSSKPTARS